MFKYLRITTFYPSTLQYYYEHFPNITKEDYDTQYTHFINQAFGLGDFYEKELSAAGVQTKIIPLNVHELQKKWAEENQFPYTSPIEILTQQILQFQPDVVSIADNQILNEQWLTDIRQKVKSIKLIIGNCCSPYTNFTISQYKKCDFVLCCCNQLAEELRQYHIPTHIIMHGFCEDILSKTHTASKKIKVLFTGSIMPGKGFHQQRYELIETLLRHNIDLTIYGNIKKQNYGVILLKQFIYKICMGINKIDKFQLLKNTFIYKRVLSKNYPQYIHISRKIRKKIFPPKYGLDMFQLLRETDICLNSHGDIAGKDAANMRLFEATGMGCCLVTDWKANMCSLFDEGYEVITYSSPQDCVEKIDWLIKHPEKIRSIAEAGQKRCLTQYSIKQRAKQLLDIITKELSKQND